MFSPLIVIGATFWALSELLQLFRSDAYAGTTTIAAFGFVSLAWGFLFLWDEPGKVIVNRFAAVTLSLCSLANGIFLFNGAHEAAHALTHIAHDANLPLLTLTGLVAVAAFSVWLLSPFGPRLVVSLGYLGSYAAILISDVVFPYDELWSGLFRVLLAGFLIEIGLQRALESPHGLLARYDI